MNAYRAINWEANIGIDWDPPPMRIGHSACSGHCDFLFVLITHFAWMPKMIDNSMAAKTLWLFKANHLQELRNEISNCPTTIVLAFMCASRGHRTTPTYSSHLVYNLDVHIFACSILFACLFKICLSKKEITQNLSTQKREEDKSFNNFNLAIKSRQPYF